VEKQTKTEQVLLSFNIPSKQRMQRLLGQSKLAADSETKALEEEEMDGEMWGHEGRAPPAGGPGSEASRSMEQQQQRRREAGPTAPLHRSGSRSHVEIERRFFFSASSATRMMHAASLLQLGRDIPVAGPTKHRLDLCSR